MDKKENKKNLFFYAVLIILPVLFFVVLEILLRIFSFGNDLNLFVQSQDPNYLKCNQFVGKRYFSKNEETTPLNDLFLKEKPANGYRIFVLGGSTVEGFPYDANVTFPRILERRLKDIFPDRTIEVINLGMTAVNSYTLLDFADELLQQKPDAVLIYAGHNEFYGALGVGSMENGSIPVWLKKLHLSLVHFRTYQLLQKVIGGINKLLHPMTENEAKETLMQQIVGKNIIPYNSETYNEGVTQFHNNMSELLAKLKEANVPVIISDLVSNEKDLPPLQSISKGNYSGTLSDKADSLYSEAKKLEADSLFDKANEKYIKAKDLDAVRFRAPEDFNKIISDLARKFNIYKISLKKLFEKNSPHGIVGNSLITEHLHPNIDGYFLMADGFLQGLKEYKMITDNWDSLRIKPSSYYRNNWGFTELDSNIAALRIKNLKSGWPFKPDTTINNFIFTYQPKDPIDSLAFLAIKYYNVSSARVHKDLADYYKSVGEFKLASKEYLSLAYMDTHNSSNYYFAADCADKAKDYDSAVRILKESPNPDTSAYAQITLANIYFTQGKYNDAISSINKLERIHQDEENYLLSEKLKYKILKAMDLDSEAEKTLASIKKIEPGFNEAGIEKTTIILIPQKIRPYLEEAETLRKNGQLKEALSVLMEANKIKECSYSNLMIGKILIASGNPEALPYLEKAYKDFKDDPMLTYNLSILYLLKKDFSRAETVMNDFIRIKGKDNPQFLKWESFYKKQKNRK